MGDERENEQGGEDDGANDPLVDTDADAPREPWGSDPESEG